MNSQEAKYHVYISDFVCLKVKYYSVQEKMFFEGITTPKVCIKIELSRREWVSVLLLVIFDDFGMIWIPNDQLDCFQQILYISAT